ncbi:phospholipase D-like domain-containing protein [Gracilibacillus sp. YIM 98692]|uniref:phospholipase D-like domain-containing protein n=1 Tax=Gracilibacillus sp. YIM 98692 TaxID=2663532 RepID=UPI0013D0F294|nr:phospholipase D-like domain-containing protein [Gracilibacillus sp. YIM 98692]
MDALTIIGACTVGASIAGYILYKGQKKDDGKSLKENNIESDYNQTPFTLNYAFTKTDKKPDLILKNIIEQAQEKLDIAVYTFTDQGILQSILQATNRGVKVRLITDRYQSSKARGQDKILQQLKHAGVPVKVNSHRGSMHLKMAIVDSAIVTVGSYNWTKAARDKHDKILVVMENDELALEWTHHFNAMWNNTNKYKHFADSELNVS